MSYLQHTTEKFYNSNNDDKEFEIINDELKLDIGDSIFYNEANTNIEDTIDDDLTNNEITECLKCNEHIQQLLNGDKLVEKQDIQIIFIEILNIVNDTVPFHTIFEYIEQNFDIEYQTIWENLPSYIQNKVLDSYNQSERENTLF